MMDWSKLYFGKVAKEEVERAIDNAEWQELRNEMKGKSLERKYKMLTDYYELESLTARDAKELRMLQVRITNYVTALSRGGLIKVEDYRKND